MAATSARLFWPDAMLPAWFVAKTDLIVCETNRVGDNLLRGFSLDNKRLTIRKDNCPSAATVGLWSGDADISAQESIWAIFDDEAQDAIASGLAVLEKHLGILSRWSSPVSAALRVELLQRLRSVESTEGVRPFVVTPERGDEILVVGVKISPPQGLELKDLATLEHQLIRFADVVMAYQVKLAWEHDTFSVEFVGVQPAIHDATARHEAWEAKRELAFEQGTRRAQRQVAHQTAGLLTGGVERSRAPTNEAGKPSFIVDGKDPGHGDHG